LNLACREAPVALTRLLPLAHPAHVREGGCFDDEGSWDSLSRAASALSAKYEIRIIGIRSGQNHRDFQVRHV